MDQMNIDPIDEALRLLFLESAASIDDKESSEALEKIMKGEYPIQIKDANAASMIDRLYQQSLEKSFGELLGVEMGKKNATVQWLANEVNLPESVIEDLKSDAVYTNSVPIMFVSAVLNALQIPFKHAEAAILKTFDLLKRDADLAKASAGRFSPSFRRGANSSRGGSSKLVSSTGGNELFENADAMKRYLTRLNELMSK